MSADGPNVVSSDRELGLLLAAEAHRRDPGPETLGALQRTLVGVGPFLGLLGSGGQYRAVAWAPDRSAIYAARADGLDVFDPETGDGRTLYGGAVGAAMDLSPAGDLLAISSGPLGSSDALVFNVLTGELSEVGSGDAPVLSVAFDPTGRILATGDRTGWLRLWDLATGEEITSTRAHPEVENADLPPDARFPSGARHESTRLPIGIATIEFTPDGSRVVTAGGIFLRTFAAADLSMQLDIALDRPQLTDPDQRFPGRPGDVEIVEEGSQAYVALGQVVQLIDLESGEMVGEFPPSPEAGSLPDDIDMVLTDSHVVTTTTEGDIRLHQRDPRGAIPGRAAFTSELGWILGYGQDLAVTADGSRLAVAGAGGVVVLALDGSTLLSRAVPEPAWGNRAQVTADGETLMWSDLTRSPVLFDVTRPQEPPFEPSLENAYTGFLDQFGPMVLFERVPGSLAIGHYYDPETWLPEGRTFGPTTAIAGAVSPDGTLVAISRGDPEPPTVYVIDAATGQQVSPDLEPIDTGAVLRASPEVAPAEQVNLGNPTRLAWSPDQSMLAVVTDFSGAVAYDTDTWRQVGPRMAQRAQLVAVAFTPEGDHVVTVDVTGRLLVRDSETFQPTGIELAVGTTGIGAEGGAPLAFTDDGRYLIVTVDEPTVVDVESWTVVGDPFPSNPGVWMSPSSNGKFVPTVDDGSIEVWTIEPDTWATIACRAAGRNLTESEWKQFGPESEARVKTCEQWDLD